MVAGDVKDPEKFLHTGPFMYHNLKFSDPSKMALTRFMLFKCKELEFLYMSQRTAHIFE